MNVQRKLLAVWLIIFLDPFEANFSNSIEIEWISLDLRERRKELPFIGDMAGRHEAFKPF